MDIMKLWKQAEETGEPVDIGNYVECDWCGEEYTDSDAQGGFVFGGKGTCPKCAPRIEASAKKFNEEKYITERARLGETFRDFILRLRGGDNTIRIVRQL